MRIPWRQVPGQFGCRNHAAATACWAQDGWLPRVSVVPYVAGRLPGQSREGRAREARAKIEGAYPGHTRSFVQTISGPFGGAPAPRRAGRRAPPRRAQRAAIRSGGSRSGASADGPRGGGILLGAPRAAGGYPGGLRTRGAASGGRGADRQARAVGVSGPVRSGTWRGGRRCARTRSSGSRRRPRRW